MLEKTIKYLIILFLLYICISPIGAVTTAQLVWSKSIGDSYNYPTYVDTWDNGTVVYVGMLNGSILSLDVNGDTRWSYRTNGSIKRLVANANGTVAWINTRNESGIIPDNTVYEFYYPDGLRNVTDVGISRDGNFYAITELSPARITIISSTGSLIQNTSYGIANWTNIAYDPFSRWVVTSNQSDNKLYLWNLTIFTGWLQFNPTKTNPKNATQAFLDSFPYRRNISLGSYTSTTHLYFLNTTSVSVLNITQINATYYYINTTAMGRYLYFTSYGNNSDVTSVVNASFWSSDMLSIGLKPNMKNLTFYYGNKSYSYEQFDSTNTTTSFTTAGADSFTVPTGTNSVLYEATGGGGGGGNSYSCSDHGIGGGTASRVTGTLTIPTGQTSVTMSIGNGGNAGTTGGTTTLNGTIVASGGAGGSQTSNSCIDGSPGGPGGNGYWISSGVYAANGSGAAYGPGGIGGQGFGSGGGGGGAGGAGGGTGARGYVNITNLLKTTNMGSDQTTALLEGQQLRTTDNSMNFVGTQTLTGNVSDMDAPEMGGWVSAATDSPKVYHQQISITGLLTSFGTQYSGTANTGTSRMIRTSDSAAYSIEARDLMLDIYQLDGTRKGTYTSGGIVNAVDVAVKNGLWAVGGGDDGKVYIFSKDATSSWYVYYQGDTGEIITSIAVSWRGEYVIVGRSDGTLEYYTTSGVSTTATTYMVNVFVNKGGVPYSGENVTITTGSTPETAIGTYYSGKTDSSGKFSFTGEDLKYYRINVNSGEYIYSYQASSTYTTVTINIPSPMITRPYDYSTSYLESSTVITTLYSDVENIQTANVTVIDMTTNGIVHMGNYSATNNIVDTYTCGAANKSHNYKVNIQFTRSTGHTYTDTMYVSSSTFYQPSGTMTTQWLLFKYAVYSIMLMFVALGIGAASTKWGVILLPALTVLGIMIGFLPMNLYTGGLLVSAFIAMLEVMRRRQD